MKHSAIAMLASAGMASALTQQCSGTAINEGGNYFCGAVSHILYQGLNTKGTFSAVSQMLSSGECQKNDQSYGGPLAPLDQDVSIPFAFFSFFFFSSGVRVLVYQVPWHQKNLHHTHHRHNFPTDSKRR
jgi:hypothetical protein